MITSQMAKFAAEKGAFAVPTLVTYEQLSSGGQSMGLPAASITKVDDLRTGWHGIVVDHARCRSADGLWFADFFVVDGNLPADLADQAGCADANNHEGRQLRRQG